MGNDRATVEAASLLFCCLTPDDLEAVRHGGLPVDAVGFYTTLLAAEQHRRKGQRVLVVEQAGIVNGVIPPGAIPNLRPYRSPKPVVAGGGYVVRPGAKPGDPELLLIFRRGAWDLPKGKLDKGESVEACALREVREEVGIGRLALAGPAGFTVHGYPEKKRYMVKTTYWYFMRTPATKFTPEKREGIEKVEWVPWGEAPERLGYATLRAHTRRLHPPRRFPS
ncbi:MAG: NUDIX domain-containing protein [Rhodothermales bacterium]|nr:NUDIX domain-containing protein [Rhodothermales bacterium]